jgi:phage-related protein
VDEYVDIAGGLVETSLAGVPQLGALGTLQVRALEQINEVLARMLGLVLQISAEWSNMLTPIRDVDDAVRRFFAVIQTGWRTFKIVIDTVIGGLRGAVNILVVVAQNAVNFIQRIYQTLGRVTEVVMWAFWRLIESVSVVSRQLQQATGQAATFGQVIRETFLHMGPLAMFGFLTLVRNVTLSILELQHQLHLIQIMIMSGLVNAVLQAVVVITNAFGVALNMVINLTMRLGEMVVNVFRRIYNEAMQIGERVATITMSYESALQAMLGMRDAMDVMEAASRAAYGLMENVRVEAQRIAGTVLEIGDAAKRMLFLGVYPFAQISVSEFEKMGSVGQNVAKQLREAGLSGYSLVRAMADLGAATRTPMQIMATFLARWIQSGGPWPRVLWYRGFTKEMMEDALRLAGIVPRLGTVEDRMRTLLTAIAIRYGGLQMMLMKTLQGIRSNIEDEVEAMLAIIAGTRDKLRTAFGLEMGGGMYMYVVNMFRALYEALGKEVVLPIEGFGRLVVERVKLWGTQIGLMMSNIFRGIFEAIGGKDLGERVESSFLEFLMGVVDRILTSPAYMRIVQVISSLVRVIAEQFVGVVSYIAGGIEGIMPRIADFIERIGRGVSYVVGMIGGMMRSIAQLGRSIYEGLLLLAVGGIGMLVGLLDRVIAGLAAAGDELSGGFGGALIDIINLFRLALLAVGEWFVGLLTGTMSGREAFQQLGVVAREVFKDLWEGFKRIALTGLDAFVSLMEGMSNMIDVAVLLVKSLNPIVQVLSWIALLGSAVATVIGILTANFTAAGIAGSVFAGMMYELVREGLKGGGPLVEALSGRLVSTEGLEQLSLMGKRTVGALREFGKALIDMMSGGGFAQTFSTGLSQIGMSFEEFLSRFRGNVMSFRELWNEWLMGGSEAVGRFNELMRSGLEGYVYPFGEMLGAHLRGRLPSAEEQLKTTQAMLKLIKVFEGAEQAGYGVASSLGAMGLASELMGGALDEAINRFYQFRSAISGLDVNVEADRKRMQDLFDTLVEGRWIVGNFGVYFDALREAVRVPITMVDPVAQRQLNEQMAQYNEWLNKVIENLNEYGKALLLTGMRQEDVRKILEDTLDQIMKAYPAPEAPMIDLFQAFAKVLSDMGIITAESADDLQRYGEYFRGLSESLNLGVGAFLNIIILAKQAREALEAAGISVEDIANGINLMSLSQEQLKYVMTFMQSVMQMYQEWNKLQKQAWTRWLGLEFVGEMKGYYQILEKYMGAVKNMGGDITGLQQYLYQLQYMEYQQELSRLEVMRQLVEAGVPLTQEYMKQYQYVLDMYATLTGMYNKLVDMTGLFAKMPPEFYQRYFRGREMMMEQLEEMLRRGAPPFAGLPVPQAPPLLTPEQYVWLVRSGRREGAVLNLNMNVNVGSLDEMKEAVSGAIEQYAEPVFEDMYWDEFSNLGPGDLGYFMGGY